VEMTFICRLPIWNMAFDKHGLSLCCGDYSRIYWRLESYKLRIKSDSGYIADCPRL